MSAHLQSDSGDDADKHVGTDGNPPVETAVHQANLRANLRDYLYRIHKIWVIALILMIAGFATIAWRLQPSANGPVSLPSSSLYFKFYENPPESDLDITETLMLLGGTKSDLAIDISGDPSGRAKIIYWQLAAFGFEGGHTCKGFFDSTAASEHSQHGLSIITGKTDEDLNDFQIAFDLCWSRANSPASLNGSFLSALIPELYVPGKNVTLTRLLQIGTNINSTTLQEYALQADDQPTRIWPSTWEYDNADPYVGTAIYADNIAGLQEDNHNAFLSGILFGIAGACLISLVQELSVAAGERGKKAE
jgi:hypothetical protein